MLAQFVDELPGRKGLRPVEKVGQGRSFGAVDAAPVKITATGSPGEGHVKQPEVFGQQFAFRLPLVRVEFRGTEVKGKPAGFVGMKGHGLVAPQARGGPVEGTEDHGKFESLGLVKRQYQY